VRCVLLRSATRLGNDSSQRTGGDAVAPAGTGDYAPLCGSSHFRGSARTFERVPSLSSWLAGCAPDGQAERSSARRAGPGAAKRGLSTAGTEVPA
jgi:hypothetical protein